MGIRGAEWYIKHKEKIEYAIVFIVVLVLINIIVVFFAMRNNSNNDNNVLNTGIDADNQVISKPIENFNSISVQTDESVVTGDKLTDGQIDSINNIENFVSYCNNGEIKQAYSLLSGECKEELYPTIENFTELYYNKVFNGEKKNVSIENWSNNIYKVEIAGDFLSTGKYDENDIQEDYMEIVAEEESYKLNINGFLGKETLDNKATSKHDITITAVEVSTYMDYQTYTFNIKNSSENAILLDDRSNISSMYLEDENGMKYSSYTHELSDSQLKVLPQTEKNITIKYYNKFTTGREMKKIVFSRLILNYDANSPRNYGSIEINL